MSLDLNAVMDGLGFRLKLIPGLRVFDFVPDGFSPPAAVVALPETIEYDTSFARGADRCTFPVHVLVGKAHDRSARDALAAYMRGDGASSVKAVLESDVSLGGVAQSLRVTGASVSVMTVGAMDFLAATFDVDVVV